MPTLKEKENRSSVFEFTEYEVLYTNVEILSKIGYGLTSMKDQFVFEENSAYLLSIQVIFMVMFHCTVSQYKTANTVPLFIKYTFQFLVISSSCLM